MENRSYALSAGLFLILLCVGLVFAAMRLTGSAAERAHYVIESRFPVSGLQPNAPVRLRGVDVGRVGAIRFARNDAHLILIEIAVDPGAPIHQGTYARLGFLGITGLTYIQLDDDSRQGQEKPAAHIAMRPSLLDQTGSEGQALLQETARAARRINALLSDENISELSATISNARTASANIARLAGDLRPAVDRLATLSAHADRTLQRIDPLLGSFTSLAEDLRERVDALDRIGQGAEDLGHAGRAIEAAVPQLHAALDDFARSMQAMNRVLAGIEQRPQSLLFGPPSTPPGPGEAGFVPPQTP